MPTPGYDRRPVWERVFERMNEENLQKEVAATVALSQGDDAEAAPKCNHRIVYDRWGRSCELCGEHVPPPTSQEVEPFEPIGEDPLAYEQERGIRYDRASECNGDCPTPGKCEPCNAVLIKELRQDDALSAILAEWARTSGPIIPDPMSLGWRRLDGGVQDEFLRWAEDQLAQRLAIGEQEYQSHIYGFQGDPLQHGIAEQLDGLFYSWMQLRQREATPSGRVGFRVLLLLWYAYLDSRSGRVDGLEFGAWLNRPLLPVTTDTAAELRRAWQDFCTPPDDKDPAP